MLHIVLFEPEIPQNTGNIARTCAAVGAQLHLVHPLGYSLDEKHLRRAGLDYWSLVTIVEHESIATFMEQHGVENLYFFTKKANHAYHEVSYPQDVWLVFGRESTGIDETFLLAHEARTLRIPMRAEARSLNLSNSVAIATYEYMRQQDFPGLSETGTFPIGETSGTSR